MSLSQQPRNISGVIGEDFTVDFSKLPFRSVYLYSADFFCALYLPLVLFGLVANSLNIAVFMKTGVRDNITVSFLALSVSDLMYLVIMSPHIIVTILIHFLQERLGVSIGWLFDHRILWYPFFWYAFVFYETSTFITVYISIVRCACVAIPFHVKNTFTARRAIIAFVAIFISIFLLRIPMLMKKRIVKRFDKASNTTRVVYKEMDDGGAAEKLNDIVNWNILNWTSFVIMITCVVVMVTKLQASARFRASLSVTKSSPNQTKNNVDNSDTSSIKATNVSGTQSTPRSRSMSDGVKQAADGKHGKQRVVFSTKETQVVRSVILVAFVFITCQAPLMATTLARRFESQFDDTDDTGGGNVQTYIFLFAACSVICKGFALINSSVNIFVYYSFNSRYRQTMKALICKRG